LQSGKMETEEVSAKTELGEKHLEVSSYPLLEGEAEEVTGIIEFVRDVSKRKQAEEALHKQLDFEKIISDIFFHIASLPSESLDQGINYALKRTGEFFQVEHSCLLQFSAEGKKIVNTHEWCADGLEPQGEKAQELMLDNYAWWINRFNAGYPLCVSDVDEIPPEAEAEKAICKAQGTRSLLILPIIKEHQDDNQNLLGLIGFSHTRAKINWHEKHLVVLRMMAEMISNLLSRHAVEEKIRYISYHDKLTDLYNRHFLEIEMQRLDTSRQLPISIIMVDLNGLKLVNDTYGHKTGDKMLVRAAEILSNSCRKEDIIARWGGDEFIILLPQTSLQVANAISNRINRECRQVEVEGLPISMSLGVATKDFTQKSMEKTLAEAENNMYQQKLVESKSARNAVMETLLKTLEAKCFETKAHTRRMEEIALKIGERLELPPSELNRLQILIMLHDIGKINIAEETLNKKEALTQEDWETIKQHPEIGCRIARATEEFAFVAEDILAHHERWDGNGYPQGLKEEEIPLLARITAIADAYEVMSNGRPYKQAMEKEMIINEFKNHAGKQFDPQLVDIFLSIISSSKSHIPRNLR